LKRKKLISHLKREGCLLMREGRRHSVFYNPGNNKTSTVPRHNEIENFLAKKICRDLGIREISK
jgi:predicted RNA binding protein YcfA (HicA-like mRNA interferase family)